MVGIAILLTVGILLACAIFLSIPLLIWLWVTALRQKKDIEMLKYKFEYVGARGFVQNRAEKTEEHIQTDKAAQTDLPMSAPTEDSVPLTADSVPQPVDVEPQTADSLPPVADFVPPTEDFASRMADSVPRPEIIEARDITPDKPIKKDRNIESWLGRNVIGITASVLVFIGLVFLGVLAYENITETGKIVAMYLISSVILGLGIWLTARNRNNFTLVLMGCGCGSFFISILLTHIYFNVINDIVAFSLLLVWMAATLLLSKKVSSIQLSIVAHIGMAVSICFAFALGLSDQKLGLLLIYQAAAIVIILLGNIYCYKETYNLGVFISLALTVITSSFMLDRFPAYTIINKTIHPYSSDLPTALIASAFFAQFLSSCILSYLLSHSTNRLKSSVFKTTIHFANKVLWVASLITNVYFVVFKIANATDNIFRISAEQIFNAILIAVLITLGVILVHAVVTMVLRLKFNFDSKLESISILLLTGVASILLIELWSSNQFLGSEILMPRITWLIVVSLLLILAGRVTKNKAYSIGANIILALDAIFMLTSGYSSLNDFGTVFLSLGYLVLYIFIIWLQWYFLESEGRERFSSLARLSAFFLTEPSLIAIFSTSSLEYNTEILLISLTLLGTVLYLIRFDEGTQTPLLMRWVFAINEFVLIFVVSGFIAYDYKDTTSSVLYILLAALAFGLAFIRIRRVLDSNDSIAGIWSGIKLTILVLAIIQGNTTWFKAAYIFSIVCMLTALLCIIVGFVANVKTLRYYGLALIITCILKLVTYDITNLNTPLRVLTFIGGGVICFIISAIYNYTSKRLALIEKNEE